VEEAEIVIHSSNGICLMRLHVPAECKSRIPFTRDQMDAPGLYFFTLLQNNRPIQSGEIICP
jgi:hypothetical protein